MKTKTTLALLAFIFSLVNATYAQTYFSMPTTEARWGVDIWSWGAFNYRSNTIMSGDTTINGVLYKKMYRESSLPNSSINYYFAMREEAKIVYCVPRNQSQEYPIYDFSKTVGETVNVYSAASMAGGSGFIQLSGVVQAIDMVYIDGSFRQQFTIDFGPTTYLGPTYEWIEGIGSTLGVEYTFVDFTDTDMVLICHTVDQDLIHTAPPLPWGPSTPIVQGGCHEPFYILPLELTDFKLHTSSNFVYLDWTTTSETGIAGMEIQRAMKNQSFQRIGFQEGLGSPSSTTNYSFVDEKPPFNENLYYRLKVIDEDGTFDFSDVLSTKVKREIPASVLFPNPAKDYITVSLAVKTTTFTIYNNIGEVISIQQSISAGNNLHRLNLVGLEAGVYFLKADGSDFSGSFLKVR